MYFSKQKISKGEKSESTLREERNTYNTLGTGSALLPNLIVAVVSIEVFARIGPVGLRSRTGLGVRKESYVDGPVEAAFAIFNRISTSSLRCGKHLGTSLWDRCFVADAFVRSIGNTHHTLRARGTLNPDLIIAVVCVEVLADVRKVAARHVVVDEGLSAGISEEFGLNEEGGDYVRG